MGAYKFHREGLTSEREVMDMLPLLPNDLKVIACILYLFGCRVSEVLKLKRTDFYVQVNNLCLKIQVSKKRKKASSPYDQNVHILRVDLKSPFMESVILPFLDNLPDAISEGKPLFPYTRQIVEYYLKKANRKISPHIFRKDRLTKLALQGASAFDLQDWAGWADVSPSKAYVQMDGRLAAKFADKIE